jgi:hypothetical protein
VKAHIAVALAATLTLTAQAHAEAPPTTRAMEPVLAPLTERLATFLGNGDWRKVRVPGTEPEPQGWLYAWTQRLREELQPRRLAAAPVASPLLQRPVKLVRLGRGQPGQAAEVAWTELTCPSTGGKLWLDVTVLHVTDAGDHWLGIDLACDRGSQRLHSARLVAQVSTEGRVRATGGLYSPHARAMPADATLAPHWLPAGKRWQWPHAEALPNEALPNVATTTEATTTEATTPLAGSAPMGVLLDVLDQPEPSCDDCPPPPARRYLWWLDADALPRQSLLDGETAGQPARRLPRASSPWLEAGWVLAPIAVEEPDGPRWTHAEVAAWQWRAGGWQVVPVLLPNLGRDGLWGCEPVEPRALRCTFHGHDLQAGVVELTLPWHNARFAPLR